MKAKLSKLPIVSNQILENVACLRDQHRLFSAMVALTSKGTEVCNLMPFKKRDAIKYVLKEYDDMRTLIQLVEDIE